MANFQLDSKLIEDCLWLGESNLSILLLMNNAHIPWFILVPKVVDITEIYQLKAEAQQQLLTDTNYISRFLYEVMGVDKVNIGAIGNIVSQLHVHIVGRSQSDFCWPDVVWGTKQQKIYTNEQVEDILMRLKAYMGGKFKLIRK